MRVRYRSRAREDLESIYDRITRDNPLFAQRVEGAIRAAGELLSAQPELGVDMGHKDARRWPMTDFHYTIFYRVNLGKEVIEILRVIDGRRVRNLKRVPH